MIKFTNNEVYQQMIDATKSGDENAMKEAWRAVFEGIAQRVKNDYAELANEQDVTILAQRGYRQLTTAEKKWYNRISEALKSPNYKQAFVEIIGSEEEEDLMPQTIIEDVFRDLRQNYELLSVINFNYVGYVTKWILNDHTVQRAIWGPITDEITKEITSGFKVIDLTQNKLSAFAFIERGMLDMGPTFLDAYIRACLAEAIYFGLEYGITKGTGVNEPIGLIKDISATSNFNSVTGWDDKEKVAITEFSPASYSTLLTTLAESEAGKPRRFNEVCLLVNQKTYLSKVIPATKVMGMDGRYVSMLDSIFATKIIISNVLEDDEGVIFLPSEYFFGVGAASRNGVIEQSDEFKFLDDLRYFKIVHYGAGRCYDNTSAIYLDLTNLAPAKIPVKAEIESVVVA